MISFLVAGCLLLQLVCHSKDGFAPGVEAFTASPSYQSTQKASCKSNPFCRRPCSSGSISTSLKMGVSPATSRISVSVPSQAKCEELGVREWPQQSKKGIWNEEVAPENSLVRYVLEGSGSLEISQDDATSQVISVTPGTLVEIGAGTPNLQLEWKSEQSEMILLTPGFEEGGVLLGALAGIVVLFGALLTGALG